MKGFKVKRSALFLTVCAVLMTAALIFAGCDNGNTDSGGGGGASIAITSDANAKTLTLVISGGEWQLTGSSTVNDIAKTAVNCCFEVTGTGTIIGYTYVTYTGDLSSDKKTLTVTVSSYLDYTGTITYTPSTKNMDYLWNVATVNLLGFNSPPLGAVQKE